MSDDEIMALVRDAYQLPKLSKDGVLKIVEDSMTVAGLEPLPIEEAEAIVAEVIARAEAEKGK